MPTVHTMLRTAAGALALFAALALLATAPASAEIYKYKTAEGEVVLTTEPRDDLELIEIIGSPAKVSTKTASARTSRPKTVSSLPASRPRHRDREQPQIAADQTIHDHIIREAAEAYQLPFAFIKAVVKIESNYNTHAVSRVGAMGLMQLMPGTAEDMGVADAFDARQNIFGGTRYLRLLANRYNGDINLVLAAYNAGPGNVDKVGGIPFEATRGYVRNVYRWYKRYEEAYPEAGVPTAQAAP